MNKIIATAVIFSYTLTSNLCYAEEIKFPPLPNVAMQEPDVGAAISPMKRNDKAVFTGLLFSPKAVATIIAQINASKAQVKLEVDKAIGEEKARCEFNIAEQKTLLETDKKILQTQLSTQQNDISILNNKIKEYENSRQNSTLWLGTGFVTGIFATLLTVFVASKINK